MRHSIVCGNVGTSSFITSYSNADAKIQQDLGAFAFIAYTVLNIFAKFEYFLWNVSLKDFSYFVIMRRQAFCIFQSKEYLENERNY